MLEGFEEAPAQDERSEESRQPESPAAIVREPALQIGGSLSQEAVVAFAQRKDPSSGTDRRGLSSLGMRLDLEARLSLPRNWRAQASGRLFLDPVCGSGRRRSLPKAYRDDCARNLAPGEAYVQGRVRDDLDLKLGRQIAVLGRSDFFRVMDVLNPLDNRAPGMTDVADLRLPVPMARADWFAPPWRLAAFLAPGRDFDRTPVAGSDFAPDASAPPPRGPRRGGLGEAVAAVSVTGTFEGYDLTFAAASRPDFRPRIVRTADGPRRRHDRIRTVGAAGIAAFGNWLLRGEAALFRGLRFANAPERAYTRIAILAGAEYAGIADTALALEAMHGHIRRFDQRIESMPDDRRRNEPALALRVNRRFLHDRVEATLVALARGDAGESGALQRFEVTVHWTDSVELAGGLVFYQSGDRAPFRDIGRNDRLFLRLKHSF